MLRNFVITFAVAVAMISACIAAPCADTVVSAAQEGAFTMTPVVLRGDPRSGGGTFFDCDACDMRIASEHGLNDLGEVVIFGFAGNCGSGVYVVSGRTGFPIVDACHPSPFGRLALFIGANINNQGQVALNMGPAVNNTIVDMILLYSDGQLSKIVADGDPSPTGKVFGNCGFSLPSINNQGEIAFSACFQDDQGGFAGDGVFVSSEGTLRKIAVGLDPSPVGGKFAFALVPPPRVSMNDNGDVLFMAGQIDPDITAPGRFGLFLVTADGIKKIELSRDTMPNGSRAADNSIGLGSLNNKGDVIFSLRLSGKPKSGMFLYSGGQLSTIILDRGPTPIGRTFDRRSEIDDPTNKVNDNPPLGL